MLFWPLALCEITGMNLHINISAIFTLNNPPHMCLRNGVCLPLKLRFSLEGQSCTLKIGIVVKGLLICYCKCDAAACMPLADV